MYIQSVNRSESDSKDASWPLKYQVPLEQDHQLEGGKIEAKPSDSWSGQILVFGDFGVLWPMETRSLETTSKVMYHKSGNQDTISSDRSFLQMSLPQRTELWQVRVIMGFSIPALGARFEVDKYFWKSKDELEEELLKSKVKKKLFMPDNSNLNSSLIIISEPWESWAHRRTPLLSKSSESPFSNWKCRWYG